MEGEIVSERSLLKRLKWSWVQRIGHADNALSIINIPTLLGWDGRDLSVTL